LKDSIIQNNSDSGVYIFVFVFSGPPNHLIYNNIFNNTNNFYFSGTIYPNYWNTSYQEGENIWNASLGYIGGNFWTNPDGTGYSDTCLDTNADGFCDDPYVLAENNTDYLPIAKTIGQYPTYINISSCSVLDQEGATYYLTEDIIDQNVSACISINANNITLDCQNHLIDGVDFYVPQPDEQMSFGIISNGYNNIAIRNCKLSDWSHPLNLQSGENITVEKVEAFSGVWIGPFVSDSNNVYFSNITIYDFAQDSFTFRNTINSRLENAVIYNVGHHGIAIDENSNNISLENIEVFNTSDIGINVNGGSNHVLRNLTVHSTKGISVWGGSNHLLEDIETFDTTPDWAGVWLLNPQNTVLRNIYSHDEYRSVLGGTNNTLEYSRCENVTWGCWHLFGNNITVRHNDFPSGMGLFGSSYGEIYNNTIGDGISMQDWDGVSSSYNEIYNNYIYKETPCGISLANSNDNLIYNNIINSSQAVCFGENIYTNYWNTSYQEGENIWNASLGYIGGNFWTNPNGNGYSDTCLDTNADGFCDDPYVLAQDNIDYLPIARSIGKYCVEPYENMAISSTTTLCEGSYYLNDFDRNGAIYVSGSNFVIICDNTEIYGDYNTNFLQGIGFKVENARNVTIVGCKLREYANPIEINSTEDLVLKGLNITHWGTRGIWGLNNTRTVVRDSYFSNHTDTYDAAIDFSGGEDDGVYPCENVNSFIWIYNNTFNEPMVRGVRFGECVYNSTVESNTFINTYSVGVDLGMYGIRGETWNNTIKNNFMFFYFRPPFGYLTVGARSDADYTIITNNTMIGQSVVFFDSNDGIAEFNNITNVSHGILVYFGDNNRLRFNYVDASGTGFEDGSAVVYQGTKNVVSSNNTYLAKYLVVYRRNYTSENILSCNNSVTYNYSYYIYSNEVPVLLNVMREESDSCTPYISYTTPTQISFGNVVPNNTYVNDTEETIISSNMINITFSLKGTSDFVSNSHSFSISNLNFSADKNFPYPVEEITLELNSVKRTFLFLVNQTNNIIYNLWRLTIPNNTPAGSYVANVTLEVST
jgi:parallel beta-helix repeat protein